MNSVRFRRWVCAIVLFAVAVGGCGGSRQETIGGVELPIPGGMTRAPRQGIEISLPGFGGAQATYEGTVAPETVAEFYKREMPARGWQPAAGIVGKGGMLSYTKQGTGVMIAIAAKNGGTALTVMVGGGAR